MDLNFLQNTLRTALEQAHLKPTIRYHNIGFSSKDLCDLDDITQTLRGLLPGYTLWRQPGMQSAPESVISRKHFQDQILTANQAGI
ncbi:MAG: hypothetical protein P1P78_15585, partial [Methyloprofundus sp.]|nr:hypothetical protein [Methyloprofundus sp.]